MGISLSPDVALVTLSNIPPELMIWAALVVLLDVKHKWLFLAAVFAAVCSDFVLAHILAGNDYLIFGIVFSTLYRGVLPFALSGKHWPQTLGVLLCIYGIIAVTTGILAALSITFTGEIIDFSIATDHIQVFICLKVLQLVMIAFMLLALIWLSRRIEGMVDYGYFDPWSMAIPVTQAIIISIPFYLEFTSMWSSTGFALLAAAMMVLCTVADIIYFGVYHTWLNQQHQDLLATALLKDVERLQSKQGDLLASAEATAMLRHDFANQTQMIEQLCRNGRTAEAQESLQQLRQRLEQEAQQ